MAVRRLRQCVEKKSIVFLNKLRRTFHARRENVIEASRRYRVINSVRVVAEHFHGICSRPVRRRATIEPNDTE